MTPTTDAINVVIADDDAFANEALSGMVARDPGLAVVGRAANGNEAVDLVTAHEVHVVLMDIRMPLLDGIDATRELRRLRPAVKILLLTSLSDDELVSAGMRAGASGFLLKASNQSAILASIHAVAKGMTVLSSTAAEELIDAVSPSPARPPLSLTDREEAVLQELCAGSSNAEIASRLNLAIPTVKSHVTTLMRKFGVKSRAKVVARAHEGGMAGRGPADRKRPHEAL